MFSGSLSVNFGFHPLFLFADDVLLCFVYAVITVDTVARETLNSSDVFVTDAPANRTPTICPLSKSERSRILPIACCNRRRTKRIIHWNIIYKTCHVNCALHTRWIIYTEAVLPTCNKLYYIAWCSYYFVHPLHTHTHTHTYLSICVLNKI